MEYENEVIIVGAGVVGTSLAYSLACEGRKVLLIERDKSEPDRIVGELLQPGGVIALYKLGLENCVEEIDAIDVEGYAVFDKTKVVVMKYPLCQFFGLRPTKGKSFHHGRFIMRLREKCKNHPNITFIEGVVKELTKKDNAVTGITANINSVDMTISSDLIIVADGCFSNLRKQVSSKKPTTSSHFVGLILKDCCPPIQNHGHVVLTETSPILLYQISSTETRILIDIVGKVPSISNGSMKEFLRNDVKCQLPESTQEAFEQAINGEIKVMPNSLLPSTWNNCDGVMFVGDSFNMRHPLTGGGMTVALNDVVLLKSLLSLKNVPSFKDYGIMQSAKRRFYWQRKMHSSVINILAQSLYAIFSASSESLQSMREACFKYFEIGGACQSGPMSLLAGLAQSPMLLLKHYIGVAFYGTYLTIAKYKLNIFRPIHVLYTAVRTIFPFILLEIK